MRIVFWQNMLAIITSPYIQALAEKDGLEVVWITEESLAKDRKDLGWGVPEPGKAKIIVAPDKKTIKALIYDRPNESVHIFSGHYVYPMVKYAFCLCKNTTARIGFISEPFDGRGIRGAIRFIRSRLDAIRHRERIDFILAIGKGGVNWFIKCGWAKYKVYPFLYLVDQPAFPKRDIFSEREGDAVKLIFVGQCIARKGVDILLKALKPLSGLDWFLTIIGEGPLKTGWARLAEKSGLSSKVNFLPAMKHSDAMHILAKSDLLVLPSRFDGWGAVVNEALMLGVPVICSDRCGAKDLLKEEWRGTVFKSGSISDLSRVLEYWIKNGKRIKEEVQRIKTWSECIDGKRGAEYILKVINSSTDYLNKPKAPWFLCA